MLEDLKTQVFEANLALVDAGLVVLTWGNVSGRDPATGLVAIKPSGVDYGEMVASQMVIVDVEGTVVEGDLRPSSDTPTHLELYRSFSDIGGVAHTHSTYATAWAQAHLPIPCLGTTHADSFRGAVPVTAPLSAEACAGDYECETGRCITRVFEWLNPHEVPGVLVAGHGPFTWGPSAAAAVENSVILEYVAQMAAITEGLNPEIGPIATHLQDKHFLRKHGSDAYYGQQKQ